MPRGRCFGVHGQMALAGIGVLAFILAAGAFVLGRPTDNDVTQIIAGDNITISPENGYGIVTINSTGVGDGAIAENENNVTKIIAGENITISPENGYGDVTINAAGYEHPDNDVTRIIAGENITISPENGYGDVTITAAGNGAELPDNNVTRIIAGDNIIISPDNGYNSVTISVSDNIDNRFRDLENSLGWKKIVDWTAMSGTSQVTITGLDINADGAYMIIFTAMNFAGAGVHYRMYYENNLTDANYYHQYLYALDAAVGGSELNYPMIGGASNLRTVQVDAILILPPGSLRYPGITVKTRRDHGSDVFIEYFAGTTTFNVSNITQIDIKATDGAGNLKANGIWTGSRLFIFGVN